MPIAPRPDLPGEPSDAYGPITSSRPRDSGCLPAVEMSESTAGESLHLAGHGLPSLLDTLA